MAGLVSLDYATWSRYGKSDLRIFPRTLKIEYFLRADKFFIYNFLKNHLSHANPCWKQGSDRDFKGRVKNIDSPNGDGNFVAVAN